MIDIAEALAASFDEVYYTEFYRDLFPLGEFERKGIYEDGKYNGIAVAVAKGEKRTRRYTVTDDLDVIMDMVSTDDFCLMSPISYAGKSRKSANARFMYALAIDLDGIDTLDQWHFFVTQIEKGHEMLSFVWGLPKPTYLVASGTGVHIYYVFEKPVPMFKNIVEQLDSEILDKKTEVSKLQEHITRLQEHAQKLLEPFKRILEDFKRGLNRADVYNASNEPEKAVKEVIGARDKAYHDLELPEGSQNLTYHEALQKLMDGEKVYLKDGNKIETLDRDSITFRLSLARVANGQAVAFTNGGLTDDSIKQMTKDFVKEQSEQKIEHIRRGPRRGR